MSIEAIQAGLPFPHGFFARTGGVSEGNFASLNGSLNKHDAREAVLENRARAARHLGADPGGMVGLTQVHGAETVVVESAWRPGEGPSGDAFVTDRPGITLAIVTADCAPVLFGDAEAGVIGAAHAGWKGAVAGILESTLAAMVRLGARPGRVVAAVGPCIGQASYEVTASLRDPVLAQDGAAARFFRAGRDAEHWQFDLPGYCAARLAAAGVGVVRVTGHDTLAEPARFFSHRRRTLAGEGPIGHQMSVITR